MATVLTLADFQDKLRIAEYSFEPSENSQSTRSIGGLVYKAARGPKIWQGEIATSAMTYAQHAEVSGIIDRIRTVGTFFLFSPAKNARPAAYKAGDALNAVQVNGTQVAGFSLKLKGLPANYVLTAGDCLSFVLTGAHRLYRITANAQANASGQVTVSLHTPLNSGALPAGNLAVTLISPRVTCVYSDGSLNPGRSNLSHVSGFTFNFSQVFRV